MLHAGDGRRRRAHGRGYPRPASRRRRQGVDQHRRRRRPRASSRGRRKNSATSASSWRSTPAASRRDGEAPRWEIFTHGGRRPTGLDAVDYAREVVSLGAGEILLTSMDRDGTKAGFRHRADPRGRRCRARAGDRLGRRRHARPSGRRHPRRPCERRARRLDLPFRHLHDRRGEGAYGESGDTRAAAFRPKKARRRSKAFAPACPISRSKSWPAIVAARADSGDPGSYTAKLVGGGRRPHAPRNSARKRSRRSIAAVAGDRDGADARKRPTCSTTCSCCSQVAGRFLRRGEGGAEAPHRRRRACRKRRRGAAPPDGAGPAASTSRPTRSSRSRNGRSSAPTRR